MKELFIIQTKYWLPMAGGAQIFAKSKEDAVAIITEAHKDFKDFEIIDVSTLDEIQAKQAELIKARFPAPSDDEDESSPPETAKETAH